MKTNPEKIWKILRSYEGEVFGYLKGALGDGDLAHDLFQEVYLAALENLAHLDVNRSLKNWLMTVARNRVINFYRDSGKRSFTFLNEQALTLDIREPVVDEHAFRFALEKLPHRQREALLRRELDGESYEALSKELGLKIGALTSLLKRARENFKRQYQIYFLPRWVRKNPYKLPVDDLLRLVTQTNTSGDILFKEQERSQIFFSSVRHQWDTLRKRFFPAERLQQIFEYLGHLQEARILDAGSGSGMVAVKAALRSKQVVAADLNVQMVHRLNNLKHKLALENLAIVRCDIRHLCFKKSTFNIVFAALVLHHLPRPELWLAEAARVLRKQGKLIVVDFDRHGNKQLADIMHDLWLGFPPKLVKRWAAETHLQLTFTEHWQSVEGVPVYAQIYQKG